MTPDAAHLDLPTIRRLAVNLTGVDADDVTPTARLIDDLGFDSLALAELVNILIDRHGLPESFEPAGRDWASVTVTTLLDASA